MAIVMRAQRGPALRLLRFDVFSVRGPSGSSRTNADAQKNVRSVKRFSTRIFRITRIVGMRQSHHKGISNRAACDVFWWRPL